ncbi:hypothetical protein Acsp05_72480 [Actinokineospora sp. NBRC 105648]|nr:hypothetical protein Acsp05_72480 [Actinokineospora sp. NBRC 105648]
MITALLSRHDPDRGRHWKPRKLHADKAYDSTDLRNWLRRHRTLARIARCGIESSQRLGRHRWAIEGTMSWLTGYRRLTPRHERPPQPPGLPRPGRRDALLETIPQEPMTPQRPTTTLDTVL